MKVLIDDICDVLNNHWPSKDWYMDDCGEVYDEESHGLLNFNKQGRYLPKTPGELVDLADFDFHFAWQGKGQPEKELGSFSKLFKKIQKAKTSVTLLVEIPKDDEKTFRIAVGNMGKGYKILK